MVWVSNVIARKVRLPEGPSAFSRAKGIPGVHPLTLPLAE